MVASSIFELSLADLLCIGSIVRDISSYSNVNSFYAANSTSIPLPLMVFTSIILKWRPSLVIVPCFVGKVPSDCA